jgi:glycosyltransferase involved in cell wall biosynthesis
MQDSLEQVKVAVVTVVFGDRFRFLRQVLDACLADPRYVMVIIVDNGCHDTAAMAEYLAPYAQRVTVLRQEKNIGYSGAIAKGLTAAREVDCDYVFVLDDDSVPEAGAIDHFLANARLFPPDQKFILLGNRIDVPGNKDIFTRRPLQDQYPRGTLFEVFSWRKLRNAFMLVRGLAPRADSPFLPIVPTEGFVTGGTLLPISVVRTVDVPDASVGLSAVRVCSADYS